MAKPTHRVTISRKDGQDIAFRDYKGDQVSKKYCPIGALFPSKIEGGFSFALERKVTLDPEVIWVNVYPNEEREEKTGPAPGGTRRRTKPEMFDDADLPD